MRNFLGNPIAPRIVVVALAVASIVATIVGSANARSLFQKMVPASDDAIARRYINLLRHKQLTPILETVDNRVSTEDAKRALDRAGSILQRQVSPNLNVNGFRWDVLPSGKRVTLSYESSDDRSWALILVSFATFGNKIVLDALRVQPLSQPLEVTNALTFKGKGLAEYCWMLATGTIGIFVLFTLFSCAWEPHVQFRWIWMPIVVTGLVRFSMNWTTGESIVTPISLGVPPIAFNQVGPGMPWIVSFLLPVGALLYWCFRKKLQVKKQLSLDPGIELAPEL